MAQADTPEAVQIPNTWAGLAVWAVGRFGIGALVAAVFWQAWREERLHSHTRNDKLVEILESRAKIDAEMSLALGNLTRSIDDMRREAGNAHLRSSTAR